MNKFIKNLLNFIEKDTSIIVIRKGNPATGIARLVENYTCRFDIVLLENGEFGLGIESICSPRYNKVQRLILTYVEDNDFEEALHIKNQLTNSTLIPIQVLKAV